MSEPQQPPVPSSAGPSAAPPAPPSAAPLAAQPQYPASPQYPAQPPHPARPLHPAAAPHTPEPAPAGNALGRVALIVAALTLGVSLLLSLLYPLVYSASSFMISIFSIGTGFVTLAGAATAVILGVIAARRPAPHLLAGIAIGIGAAIVAGRMIDWLSMAFYRFF